MKYLHSISISGSSGISWDEPSDVYTVTFDGQPSRSVTDIELLSGAKVYALASIRAEANALIESKWPLWKQNNCAMGVYPESVSATCADDIAAVVAASNAAEDAVDAATTVAEVEAVTPVWPII